MNIVIKTGFQNISHNILFQPETVPKGKLLFEAKHILNVEEHRENGVSYLIKAKVIRQTSVTSPPYDTKLHIDAMRKVTSVECSCVYNKSGKCKHVAGLIYYVNHEESLTKTNLEQQWGKPTLRQLCQEKYSKGKNFHEMFPLQTSITVEPCDVDISELIDPSPLRAVLLEAQKDKTERSIKSLIHQVFGTSFVNSAFLFRNGGITSITFFPALSIVLRISGKPLSARTTSPSSNRFTKPDSIVICESLFRPPATFDLKLMKPPGVTPMRSFAVNVFL